MLSMMTALAIKHLSATGSTAVNKTFSKQWREHTPLLKTLVHIEHIHAFAIIYPHACPRAVVELAKWGENSRWNTKASQNSPQQSAIGGVIGFGKVD